MKFEFSPELSDSIQVEAMQVYKLRLFTPRCAQKICEALDLNGEWESEQVVDRYGPGLDVGDHEPAPKEMQKDSSRMNEKESAASDEDGVRKSCQSFATMPGFYKPYKAGVEKYLYPVMKELWPTFTPRIVRNPYCVKYDADDESLYKEMRVHWDQCIVSLVVALNDGYEGGGTFFPELVYATGRVAAGSAIIYPGGVAHEHGAKTVTKGKRYVLVCEFF